MYVNKTIYNSAPENEPIDKVRETFEVLDKLNIQYTRIEHEEAMSIQECEAIEKVMENKIAKNLFLTNSAKTQYYLLILPGEKQFKTKVVSKIIGSTRLSFGSYDKMEEYLNLTPGSVSIMGLMYDKNHEIELLIDEDLLKEEYICFHPCLNTGTVKAKTSDMFNIFLPYSGHTPRYIPITYEE